MEINYSKNGGKGKKTSLEAATTKSLVKMGFHLDAEMKARKKQLDPIKAELIKRSGNYADDEGVEFEGNDNTVAKLSARPESVSCTDPEAVLKIMGTEAFFKIAQVPVSALKEYLTTAEIEAVTEKTYNSRRTSFKKTG